MTEQRSTPDPAEDDGREGTGGTSDPARAGGGRTAGETSVDDALGSGPDRPDRPE